MGEVEAEAEAGVVGLRKTCAKAHKAEGSPGSAASVDMPLPDRYVVVLW